MEYTLHRFAGHEYPAKNPFYIEHTTHHSEAFYFAPARSKFLAAFIVCSLFTLIGSLMTGLILNTFIFVIGFVSMYLFYEWTHYSIHAFPPKTKLGLLLRKHHLAHHFHAPKKNFGVTTTFFDYIFRSKKQVSVVKVPLPFAPEWLKANPEKFKNNLELR